MPRLRLPLAEELQSYFEVVFVGSVFFICSINWRTIWLNDSRSIPCLVIKPEMKK